ncbi:MAG: hypothetical protein FJY55_02895 [Betaproteobacteria bacterium]|nr:hypothetical protein [Betaproteobacteria bacterium]
MALPVGVVTVHSKRSAWSEGVFLRGDGARIEFQQQTYAHFMHAVQYRGQAPDAALPEASLEHFG